MYRGEQMRFTKMQGLGNDYIYIDGTRETVKDPDALARAVSDVHFGAGSDGLVLILPDPEADFRMRMFNADGSEAEMCGNAARCIGKYVFERGLTDKTEIRLMTGNGIRHLQLQTEGNRVLSVRVDMGMPAFGPEEIPVNLPGTIVINHPVKIESQTFEITCVSMGNPHAAIFVDDADSFDVSRYGPLLENHPLFPKKANIEFITVRNPNHLRMRVWERGSGETWACGTGACASLVAGVLTGRCGRKAVLSLNGGDLMVEWDKKTGHVFQSGPAAFVYDGEWLAGD